MKKQHDQTCPSYPPNSIWLPITLMAKDKREILQVSLNPLKKCHQEK